MEARAKLRYYRQSPKKVRQVADVVRGKDVVVALAQLSVLPKRAAKAVHKLLNSAVANAENRDDSKLSREDLFIKEITVDQGPTYKRFMPRAHGRATMLRKKTSHIQIVLAERNAKATKDTDDKKETPTKKIEKEVTKKAKPAGTKTAKKNTAAKKSNQSDK